MSLTLERLFSIFGKWNYQNLEGVHTFTSEHGTIEVSSSLEIIKFKKEGVTKPVAFLSNLKTKKYRLWDSSEVRWDELSRRLMQISSNPEILDEVK